LRIVSNYPPQYIQCVISAPIYDKKDVCLNVLDRIQHLPSSRMEVTDNAFLIENRRYHSEFKL
jgi:hypothetical protein